MVIGSRRREPGRSWEDHGAVPGPRGAGARRGRPDLLWAAAAWFGLLVGVAASADGRTAPGVPVFASEPVEAPAGPVTGRDTSHREVHAVRRRVYAMGTLLTGTVWADRRSTAVGAFETALRSVEAMEDRLSTWREDTELAAVNAAREGRRLVVGDTLFALLQDARRWWRATGGAFDPGVGRLVEAWDLRGRGRVPSGRELRTALAASGMECWTMDADRHAVTARCPGAWIDAGAFGKGAAFRSAERSLREQGARGALLDFGGQVLAVGRPPGRDAWRVGVAHPTRRGESVATLEVADRSVATTSASERFVVVDGERRGHVLDPRTGEPVPAWGSVTVVTEDPLAADALSTALFVRGPRAAMDRAGSLDGVGVLVLVAAEEGVRAGWNRAMEAYLVTPPAPAPGRGRERGARESGEDGDQRTESRTAHNGGER